MDITVTEEMIKAGADLLDGCDLGQPLSYLHWKELVVEVYRAMRALDPDNPTLEELRERRRRKLHGDNRYVGCVT